MNWIPHIKIRKTSNADVFREIVQQSLAHGIELLSHVELMEAQNSGGVNESLSKAGLGNAAIAIRNAMMTRVVLMVAREFLEAREADRNLHRAFDLLNDQTVREIFGKNPKAVTDAEAYFKKCKGFATLDRARTFLGDPRMAMQSTASRMLQPFRRPDPPVLRNKTELHVDSFAK